MWDASVEREREMFEMLVCSPDGYNAWGLAKLKLGDRSHPVWVQGTKHFGHLTLLFPGHLQVAVSRSRAARI